MPWVSTATAAAWPTPTEHDQQVRVGTPQQRMALLVGGVMDGALVPLDVDVQQHEVFDSDRGPQRYEATSEVTASGHQVFALVEKPQA